VIIAPSFLNNTFANVALLEMAEGKSLYAVNGLSTLFMSLSIKTKVPGKKINMILFIHGIVAPTAFGALLIKQLFVISATVGITYPISAILICMYIWKC
jgi:hypothetical protein